MVRLSKEEFIERSIKLHGNSFTFDKLEYLGMKVKSTMTCNKHGDFISTPDAHLRPHKGGACHKCVSTIRSDAQRDTIEEIKNKIKEIYSNRYECEINEYVDSRSKIKVYCTNCSSYFNIRLGHLLAYHGCKCTKTSKGELLIENYLLKNNITYEREKTFMGCVYNSLLRFDFYLPDTNTVIEYDGIQHFMPTSFKKSRNIDNNDIIRYEEQVIKDKIKNTYCMVNNIKLIRIPYTRQKSISKILDSSMIK